MNCPECVGKGTTMQWDADPRVQNFTEVVCFLCNGMGTHPYGGQ